MIALVFPGQGSQAPLMGKEFYDSFEVSKKAIELASEGADIDLANLIFAGSEDDLKQTQNAQVAIMATSIAILRAIEQEAGKKAFEFAAFAAGHSLGEYAALVAGDSIGIREAASLLKKRGLAMKQAAELAGAGGMSAVLGLSKEVVEEVIASLQEAGKVLEIANDNCPGQIVISGHVELLEKAAEILKEKGAKRVLPLAVSGAFHSSLMMPAAQAMQPHIEAEEISMPKLHLIQNVAADEPTSEEEIKKFLVAQIAGQVRWTESVNKMISQGVKTFIEVGNGRVLSGLIAKINPEVKVMNCALASDLPAIISELK